MNINALVAEHVMGIAWDEDRCRICGWPLSSEPIHGCTPDNCSMRPPPVQRADSAVPYATDIAAAWQVVERFGDYEIYYTGGECGAALGGTEYRWAGEAQAPTAPLAICLAALKAVGVKP